MRIVFPEKTLKKVDKQPSFFVFLYIYMLGFNCASEISNNCFLMVAYRSEGPEAGTMDDTEGWWHAHCGAAKHGRLIGLE
jgi:hypothetical protein